MGEGRTLQTSHIHALEVGSFSLGQVQMTCDICKTPPSSQPLEMVFSVKMVKIAFASHSRRIPLLSRNRLCRANDHGKVYLCIPSESQEFNWSNCAASHFELVEGSQIHKVGKINISKEVVWQLQNLIVLPETMPIAITGLFGDGRAIP